MTIVLLLAAIVSVSAGQQTVDRHVVILSPDEGDPGLPGPRRHRVLEQTFSTLNCDRP
jgi:hypothetical protein